MAFLLFIDESGQDRRSSPYEVLAGIAVEDTHIWPLITALRNAETEFFGIRITRMHMELKAKRLLKSKTFRMAGQMEPLDPQERTDQARRCIELGAEARGTAQPPPITRRHLTALAQAKIAFVDRALELCHQHHARAFASIVDRDAPRPTSDFLRKDYAYLYERFYHYLEDQAPYHQGLIVFDELERIQSHILVDQMTRYFQGTHNGRLRASRIVPEPFFVHSDLTSLIQIADLIAYIISWGVRVGSMQRPVREELRTLADTVCSLRYRSIRATQNNDFPLWSFSVIDDLRPLSERE